MTADRGLSRRAFLAGSGAAALAAGLAACSSSSGKSVTTASPSGSTDPNAKSDVPGPQPTNGGTDGGHVTVGWTDEPYAFGDPARAYNLLDYDVATELVFFGSLLAFAGQTGGPIPNLATAMPKVSQDGKTLTFTLKPGLKFHNGRVIEAADFKYAWERLIGPGLKGAWPKSYFASIAGYEDLRAGRANDLAGVEVVNSTTLKVTLAQPDFMFLNTMSQTFSAPLPREEVERLGNDGFADTPVGFGPFRITNYDKNGQRATFERFDDYLWSGLPYVDGVDFRWGIDQGLIVPQLQSGDIDIAGAGIPTSQVTRVLANPSTAALTVDVPILQPLWIDINRTVTPMDDPRVRQAMNWAIDRDAVQKVTGNQAYGSPYPADLAGYTPTFTPYTYDTSKAKALLADAGVTSFSVALTHTADDATTAQVIQQQLGAVGIKVSLNQVGSSAYYDLQSKGDFQLMYTGLFLIQPTPGDLVESVYVPTGYANYTKYSNSKVTALAASARRSYDTATQNSAYAKIEQLIGDDAPGIYVATSKFHAGRGTRVSNYHYRGEYGTYYDRLWVTS
jgi:ABC-type transport system substrate-binding protein